VKALAEKEAANKEAKQCYKRIATLEKTTKELKLQLSDTKGQSTVEQLKRELDMAKEMNSGYVLQLKVEKEQHETQLEQQRQEADKQIKRGAAYIKELRKRESEVQADHKAEVQRLNNQLEKASHGMLEAQLQEDLKEMTEKYGLWHGECKKFQSMAKCYRTKLVGLKVDVDAVWKEYQDRLLNARE
ncbi:hypothetical protein LTS18_000739, partial [Coniosporium uncinatum]